MSCRSIIDDSRSIINDSRSIIDDSRSLIDASWSIIDASGSINDDSRISICDIHVKQKFLSINEMKQDEISLKPKVLYLEKLCLIL
jgi:hypothetical protein